VGECQGNKRYEGPETGKLGTHLVSVNGRDCIES
jgi:hypothetical protein